MVSILGAGESGVGAALLAKAKGYQVFLSDFGEISGKYRQILAQNQIAFEEGKHTIERLLKADLIVKSPGIPRTVPVLKSLREAGIPIISEIEFASRYTKAKIIAITGTNGKTTTTLLIGHLLKSAGINVAVGGNIGNSFAALVIEDAYDFYVLEISSFQLDDIVDFQPNIAVILNVTADHLDRYNYDFDQYLAAKLKLVKNQGITDHLIYNYDDESLQKGVSELVNQVNILETSVRKENMSGGFLKDGFFWLENGDKIEIGALPLYGKHNQSNALAALLAASKIGIEIDQIESGLKSFKNAPHRMEFVTELNDVVYINDSKATNVDAVYYALEGIDKKIVWIAGGVDKGNDYKQIDDLVKEKVEFLICLGKDNQPLIESFASSVSDLQEVINMNDAVQLATEVAKPGQVILLSPACASFDLFSNYEDRGDQFRNEVLKLRKEKSN